MAPLLLDMLNHFHNHALIANRFFVNFPPLNVAASAVLKLCDVAIYFVFEKFCRKVSVRK